MHVMTDGYRTKIMNLIKVNKKLHDIYNHMYQPNTQQINKHEYEERR